MPSLYALKPKFQSALRPLVTRFAKWGITANQVTMLTCLVSVAVGLGLAVHQHIDRWLLLLPVTLFIRMALNAMDGMLAREFGQQSDLGVYLNELTDVVADVCLYLPFAFLSGFSAFWMGAVIVLAVLTEMTSTVAAMVGASRRNDGPMGKSDRALAFGSLAFWLGMFGEIPQRVAMTFELSMAGLLALTVAQRVRQGLIEKALIESARASRTTV
ncbi:MAG: CDP-alcohol phosphatidyltransferase family protein [Bryobacteraceae bacterium]